MVTDHSNHIWTCIKCGKKDKARDARGLVPYRWTTTGENDPICDDCFRPFVNWSKLNGGVFEGEPLGDWADYKPEPRTTKGSLD
jgi:hypothetical protein